MIVLEIPRAPETPNNFLGFHWRHRQRNSQLWQQEIHYALIQAGESPQQRQPFERAKVHIDRRSRGELDKDNLYGCVKPVIDALRYSNVLVDDSPQHLELDVTQSRSFKLPPRTLIEIEPLPVIP